MKRRIERLYLHTAAAPFNADVSAASIRRYHKLPKALGGKGYNDIGYNEVGRKDGRIEQGRPQDLIPAGVYGDNRHSWHYCMSGHGDIAAPTEPQWDSAVRRFAEKLIEFGLGEKFIANPMRVLGHREVNVLADAGLVPKLFKTTKTCPGRKVDMTKFRLAVLRELLRFTG